MRAIRTSWGTKEMPLVRERIGLNRSFTKSEMELILDGVIPEVMEDKWFIFFGDDNLYFHRSWTGYCIYVAQFKITQASARMISADVNRDPKEYPQSTAKHDEQMINYLIDRLLLARAAEFPRFENESDETAAVRLWNTVGRAGLG